MKTMTMLMGLLSVLILSSFSTVDEPAVPRRRVSQPIDFNGRTYRLALSTQPTVGYLRQEYLPSSEGADKYRDLFMLSVLTNGLTVEDVVAMQVRKLEEIQQEDLTVNYHVKRHGNGMMMLDFVWRAYSGDSQPVIEWNAYRFEEYTSPTGKKGVLVLGNRRRAYGDNIVPFLTAFRGERPQVLKALSKYKMPAAQIAQNE